MTPDIAALGRPSGNLPASSFCFSKTRNVKTQLLKILLHTGRAGAAFGCSALWLANSAICRAENAPLVTAVAAHADSSYARTRLPDGKFKPEFYAFGEGGRWDGPMTDLSVDKLSFLDVARTVARPLESQAYLPAKDPAKAKLLIMVYWGLTTGTGSGASSSIAMQNTTSASHALAQSNQNRTVTNQASAMANPRGVYSRPSLLGSNWGTYDYNPFPVTGAPSEAVLEALLNQQEAQSELNAALLVTAAENRQRDRQNWKNASMLGYDTELAAASTLEFSALRNRHQDAVDEIEENRYFVVLMAYDFQQMARKRKHVLLWETPFSIRQRDNDFDQQLGAMADYAARYFGQNSRGLIREGTRKESIRLDELKILGEVPEK